MQLVDTHCHIQSIGANKGEANTRLLWHKDKFLTLDKVLKRAFELNVTKLICVGCQLEDSRLATEVAKEHPDIYASIGIHPHEAKIFNADKQQAEAFKALFKKAKVIAVGECGLDYYYNHSAKQEQIKALELQLELASQHNLPAIFHVREAFDDFWPILDNFKDIRGVLHSYTDNQENLDKALKKGLYIGVNGIVTFAKEHQLAVYKQIPLSSLLLETDSPFLTPIPYRGTINEPSKVVVVAEFIAKLSGKSLEEIAEATTNNANNLFGI